MKAAISATGPGVDAKVDEHFGRCPYLVFVDVNNMEAESISNPGAASQGGAGIAAAQAVVNKGIKVVITGNVGPNAYEVLSKAGVKVFGNASVSVKEAIEAFRSGKLKEVAGPTAKGHAGQGRG